VFPGVVTAVESVLQALTFWALLVLIVMNYARFRDVLYPPVIQGTVWFVVLALYAINQDWLNTVSHDFYLIVVTGVFMFAVGSYFTTYATTTQKVSWPLSPALSKTFYSRLLFWIPLLGLPLFLARAYALGHEGSSDFLLINIRHILITEGVEAGYGPLQYLLPLSFVACGLQLYQHLYFKNRLKLVVSLAVAMAYAVLSTGRGYVLLLLLMMAGIATITRKVSTIRVAVYLTVALAIGFLFTGYFLQKGLKVDSGLSENLVHMQQHATVYVVGALPAFDEYRHLNHDLEYGTNTFRSVLAALSKIGFDVEVPKLIQDFVYVPMEFNVYTVYHPYYRDFAAPGMVAVQLLFGAWHGYLYKKSRQGAPLHIFLYALFLFPLVMQCFQDQYLSLLSMWVQFGVIVALQIYAARFGTVRSTAACQA
jgi:oligosaccharide repeat unit polymerase